MLLNRTASELLDDLTRQGVSMIFARVRPYLKADMDRHGITAALGAARIFPTLHEAVAAARAGAPEAATKPGGEGRGGSSDGRQDR